MAEPVEAVHVVPVGETAEGIEALCVAHAAMREALDRIAALGLRAERLSVDALLLPWEGRPVAVRVGERILARIGPGRGFAVEASLWPRLGERLGIDLRPESWDGMESFLAAALRRGLPELPELLTPPYAVRSGGIAAGLARVAALALLCLLLALAHRAGELAAFRRAHEALRAEAAELYRALRAVDGPVPDPLPMLEAALTAAEGRGGGALPLLRRLAPVVERGSQPAPRGARVSGGGAGDRAARARPRQPRHAARAPRHAARGGGGARLRAARCRRRRGAAAAEGGRMRRWWQERTGRERAALGGGAPARAPAPRLGLGVGSAGASPRRGARGARRRPRASRGAQAAGGAAAQSAGRRRAPIPARCWRWSMPGCARRGSRPSLRRLEPLGERRVRLSFEQVAFDAAARFLEDLAERHGAVVRELSARRGEGAGIVDLRVTLERP
ncbi:MAG: type II secretion system protein GspL [Xanthomonadales bacterium]|nr:type II secretion system protein GspL [Xanthomonadales bacterium]